ncbi:hypothetical protein OEZ85_011167 [Tetradesmus obliquus]|uniref:Saposin B-type domain-containing protein n=1 Tax=Tetradesmus obliquus TaxID=3088 RepID=A0ABY8TU49_TETOB|nr:hypothetical protein OEZ85_011167 [Tetradesmus obliquus]
MARACFAVLLLLGLAGQAYCRVPSPYSASSNDACGTCKVAVRIMGDMMCDPYVDDTLAKWMVDNICSNFDEKEQCSDLVLGLTPALVQWLRVNADPDTLCSGMGVCPAAALQAQVQPRHSSSKPNDVTCPLCMYVASKLKEQVNNPVTQADIRDASLAACAALPEGMMRDACTDFVEQYEMTFVKYIGQMEPAEVCMMVGTCLDAAVARVGKPAPLQAQSVAAVARLMAAAGQVQGMMRAAAPSSNDHCDTCKVVITEMHQLVANPQIQVQLVDYAKQACALVPSFADSCKADVDQYAPMLFGMVLAYLQPEQVCIQLKLCPPPSLFGASFSMQAAVLRSKFNKFSSSTKFIRAN